MPRFYFDIDDGTNHTHDDEGQEFPNSVTACDEAIGVLPQIARDMLPDGSIRRDFIVNMKDGTGRVIFTATLSLIARWLD